MEKKSEIGKLHFESSILPDLSKMSSSDQLLKKEWLLPSENLLKKQFRLPFQSVIFVYNVLESSEKNHKETLDILEKFKNNEISNNDVDDYLKKFRNAV